MQEPEIKLEDYNNLMIVAKAKIEAYNELIEILTPRLYWESDFYRMGVNHAIEVAELLRDQTKESIYNAKSRN